MTPNNFEEKHQQGTQMQFYEHNFYEVISETVEFYASTTKVYRGILKACSTE